MPIGDWARPIFGLASDFKILSRDEREERDYAHLQAAKRRQRYGVVGKEGMEVWGGREGRYGGMEVWGGREGRYGGMGW